MKLNNRLFPLATGVMVATIACGCQHKDTTSDDTAAPSIDVAEVVTDSLILYKTYPGSLAASQKVDVVARVNGTLKSINFKGGDLVKKGQILFTIEDKTYRDAVNEASAALTTAKSSYEYSSKQYAAMTKALESDAVSQMEVLQSKSEMEKAEAAIKQSQAALSTAQTNLGYCIVKAPISGRITSTMHDPGTYLAGEGAAVTLATIYGDDALNANFYIDDASYTRMYSNENNRSGINYKAIPISFSDSLPHTYTGDLTYMAPSIDSSTGTIRVYARVTNTYGELRDGMYAEIKLPWKMDPAAMLVKDASISTDQLGKYIYVVNDSDKVVYTPIKVGDLYQDSLRIVNSGIKPGDRYVTKAMLKVRNGQTVKPVLTK